MVMPNGEAGVTLGPLQEIVSLVGANGAIPAMAGLDQPAAEDILKQLYILDNVDLGALIEIVFSGLRAGISLPLALLELLANALTGAVSGTTYFSVGHAEAALETVGETITEHTAAIANLNAVAAATNTTVAYVGDIQDMVTAPRVDLRTLGVNDGRKAQIITDFLAASSDLAWMMPIILPPYVFSSSVGNIYYSPIVVDRHGTVDKIRWIVGGDTSIFSIDYYEIALCVYNPDTLAIEKVWGSGNIKDAEASTTTLAEVAISMGIDQECSPGQVLFFAHQQTAPGLFQNTRAFAAVPQGNVGRPASMLLDAACYKAVNHSQGIPSTIDLSALTRENKFIPWGAVSVLSPVVEP